MKKKLTKTKIFILKNIEKFANYFKDELTKKQLLELKGFIKYIKSCDDRKLK